MKPEDKQLLLQDLCRRLPYGVKIDLNGGNDIWTLKGIFEGDHTGIMLILEPSFPSKDVYPPTSNWPLSLCKPYLRPLSTMTEEEARDIAILHGYYETEILSVKVTARYIDIILDDGVCGTYTKTIWYDEIISSVKCFDYLNKNMFDYYGLIPKDLALSADEINSNKD